ncbi:chromate transporter [Sphingobacterium sp. SG20118]|uniref:chromate transporter n=1 Tax=Sphingobacterium TaxID=28453 RepID=UPI0004F6B663|nr:MULTISPECIES: chromate transporter [Sphingobacterium]AIM38320.1 chromate transporter [Sphingobacterium sp. ML3W]MDH5825615.1 chromate transporter [Sphingobacterium faecium]
MIFLELIWVFIKIGIFGFGGGYAMLSMIQEEVVENNAWLTKQEFTDLVAISQMTPGPIGINSATYVGYSAIQHAGYSSTIATLGAGMTTIALCFPSFIMISIISYFFIKFRTNKYFGYAMVGIRPLSISLMAFAAVSLSSKDNFTDYLSPILFSIALFCSIKFKTHPIIILFVTAIVGILIY